MHAFNLFLFALVALGAGTAWCADVSLGVTARIGATCSFTEVPLHMGFPEIDPSGTDTHVISTVVRVRCTQGTRLNLNVGGDVQSPSLRALASMPFLGAALVHMPYTLSWMTTAEPTGGFSASAQDFVITLTGTLTPAQYQDAAAGHYEDALTLQLNP